MPTLKAYTHEVLGGYLMSDDTLNLEYLNDSIWVYVSNTNDHECRSFFQSIGNKRRTLESLANEAVNIFIKQGIEYNGHRGYYPSNPQILGFLKEHGGLGWEAFNQLKDHIAVEREEMLDC